ncbi:N-acetylmuramidase domain-containing protein [Sagittula sp.]|uniref:N-acetylmuramidase domain-containing protein n=1 Tax=Sagittula sp. TaxID=2038081 RepID=UPI003515D15A
MSYPWKGEAKPRSEDMMRHAARLIGCEVAAIEAVFKAEAAGRGYLRDGTVIRRFEPHKMPGATTTWLDSKKHGPTKREQLFFQAYNRTPTEAMEATSWGAPQIMGFNHRSTGHPSAEQMVRAMAKSEDEQIMAFVNLVNNWGLDAAIRAHDWQTFEDRYNGGGQGGAYARKIESYYRKFSGGKASPEVLRIGSSGDSVKRVQAALGLEQDGVFGPETDGAVRAVQERAGLPVDGIVGRRTWALFENGGVTAAKVQPTPVDDLLAKAKGAVTKGGSGAVAGGIGVKALERAPDGAIDLLWYGGAGLALLAAGLLLLTVYRKAKA